MKTNSYVEAVKMAVKKMEERPYVDNGWYWVNDWRMFLVNKPQTTLSREI